MSFFSKLLDRLFPAWRFSRRLREQGATKLYQDYLYYCGAVGEKVNDWQSFEGWLSCRGADPKKDYPRSRYNEYRLSVGRTNPVGKLIRFSPLYFDFIAHMELVRPTESARSRMETGVAGLHTRLDKIGADDEED